MPALGRFAFAAAPLLVLIVDCSTFDDLTLAKPSTPQDPSCRHAIIQLPSPLNSAFGEHEFVVAVRTVDYGEAGPDRSSPDYANIGFDLDITCTGEGEGSSCRKPTWADDHPDGPDGRDNAAASLIAAPEHPGGAAGATLNNTLQSEGLMTMVLRVRGYNGSPADSDVEFACFAATRSPDLRHSVVNPARWDGNDVWRPLVEWTVPADDEDAGAPGPPVARYESDRAYVSNNILVAHFALIRGAIAYNFSNAWFQGRLEADTRRDGEWSLRDAIFTGRLNIDDSLAALEFTSDLETGKPTCMDSPHYPMAKKRACALADISYAGDAPSAPCDATSWAWRFEAEPALLSDEVEPVRASDFRKCPPELSPANDHCSSLE